MLDSQSPVPLYHQLKEALVREIRSGRWRPYEAIPPERELVQRYGVSRTTVRQAVGELVSEGLLYRQHGKGTFVAAPGRIAETLSRLSGHVEELVRRGMAPDTRVLSRKLVPAPADVAARLNVEPGEIVDHVKRLVKVDGAPLVYIEAYLPMHLSQRLPVITDSILLAMEAAGVVPVRGDQRVTAVQADAETADLLSVASGAALLLVTRTVYTVGDEPVEVSYAYYRADRYEYRVDLRRRRK